MQKIQNYLKLFLVVFTLLGYNSIFSASSISWQNYSHAIFAKAKQTHRLILLYGKVDWCPWCKKMNGTFTDPNVVSLVNNNFIPVKIDIEKNESVAKHYDINNFPVLIILDANNQVIERSLGFLTPDDMMKKLQAVINESH